MIVGLDAKRFFANFTGLGTYARTTITALARYQPHLRLILFSPHATGPYASLVPQGAQVQTAQLPRFLQPLWRSLLLPCDARRHHLTIYHGLSHELPLLPMPRGVRTLVTVHDLLFLSHPHRFPFADRVIYRIKYGRSLRQAHRVLAISQATAHEIQARFHIPATRLCVVHQACPEQYFAPPPVPPAAVRQQLGLPAAFVLFVGSLTPRKGVTTLVEAIGQIPPAQRPPLVFAGTGPLESHLRHQTQRRGVAAFFLGHVPDALLPGLYAAAQLLAYPSEAEGFGLPIVEALACGTPVVTSTGSCFAEAGGPGALYVPPGDAPALAAAISRVLDDTALARHLRHAGQAHAAQFHPHAMAERLAAVYRELSEEA